MRKEINFIRILQKKMKNVKFSIIIPVYNAELYIKKCLESIFKQKYDDVEIIVIDDGSTDNSINIIKEYEKKVKIISQKNMGVSSARNAGIYGATGEWIIFLDADDELLFNSLKCLNEIIRTNEVDLIITNTISNTTKRKENLQYNVVKISNKNEFFNSIISINYYKNIDKIYENNRCIGGKVFKTDIIKKYDLKFDSKIHTFEDGFFVMNFANKCENIIFSSNEIYLYREVKTSKTHTINEKNITELENVLSKMNEVLESLDKYTINKEVYNYFLIDSYRILCNYLVKIYGIKEILIGIRVLKSKYEKFFSNYFKETNIFHINSLKEKIIINCILKKKIFLLYCIYLFK